MKTFRGKLLLLLFILGNPFGTRIAAQGTFQNLDFENGTFIPLPGDPFGRVQFGPAVPGWTGYVGTNQIDWVLHNNLFLSTAGIAIFGPDQPPGESHGRYYLVLQAGDDPFGGTSRVNAAVAQTGTIPSGSQSVRFWLSAGFIQLSFAGQSIPLSVLGPVEGSSINYSLIGGDISAFAGQSGLLTLRGVGYLDYIQFSNEPIPEPSLFGLFALVGLLPGWRLRKRL